MSIPAGHISRRRLAGLIAAASATSCLGVRAAASPDFESILRQMLGDLRLPGPPAQLDLLRLEWPEGRFGTDTGHIAAPVAAVVRMTWPPGIRQYRVTSDANADPAALVAKIRARFAAITAGSNPERSA
ncbi:MAG: hypothetical protein VXW58_06235 [Pseudomonadota bacterium]|nr:hypothetical protein [Pseudomonadota bacterium]